jgi:hypothetical protein
MSPSLVLVVLLVYTNKLEKKEYLSISILMAFGLIGCVSSGVKKG